ncbi:unnamed protein product [Rotaria sordida]|uniref:UBA domain-containing protein n=1 Tax=Rotaria sordida TaxID=392033 RepID=A0A819FGB1_9BILA|nr:unnamed protein product [Rotaria sordida]
MSVAAASGAVSTQQHRPTQEQIRLAQLIEDKKHDQPEVQEILRKVLDVVADSNQEDALVALFDCDYDFEKTVALLIEKGHEVASEWRTATNHKLTKKQQQQQKVAATKNGHGDLDENGQQRGNDSFTSRGKSRGGRTRLQQNGGDSQNITNQQNDNYTSQQRPRGTSTYRGRYRGNNRGGGYRGIDRNYQHVQDSNNDTSLPSDTNRRSRGAAAAAAAAVTVAPNQQQQQQDLWDVGNWNGETLIYSRTTKDDEQPLNSNDSTEVNNQEKSKPDFDPIEAARQIKNVIGIGQTPKLLVTEQLQKSKISGQTLNAKITPPPRIPQQPVIFSDHFDGGINKIDVQFGNLGEPFDETSTTTTTSSSTPFYPQSQSISSNKISQRTTEQSSHISPSTRPSEQLLINQSQQQQQQRILPTQIQQQPTIPIKQVVTPQYTVHQQQHPINAQNILLQSLLYHQQQPDSVTLDTSYDPTTFSLPSIDFNSPYFMAATMNQPQQQTQPRYLVSQPPPPLPQQTSSKNAQTPSISTPTSTTTTKKAPAIPPGMFPTVPPLNPAAYSTTYGVQQQTAGTNYSTPYDTEHLFTNTFMPLTNTQQAQSPSGTYGSVTPPVQQQNQQQQTNNVSDNKTMNYPPITENLMLLQQYQQYALQQSNSQQQGQQTATHSPAQLSYFLSHPPTGPSYSPGTSTIKIDLITVTNLSSVANTGDSNTSEIFIRFDTILSKQKNAGPQIMYAQAATTMPQHQQAPKQQGQQYNQNNSSTGIGGNEAYYARGSSSSNKEGQYMYTAPTQPQHVQTQSAGQQQNVNKQQQQQQRTSSNVYNNQQGQQRPFQ